MLENYPQHIGAVPDAAEVASAPEKRESDAGLDGAHGGGRRLLPVEADRADGVTSDPFFEKLAVSRIGEKNGEERGRREGTL